jgi:DNA-binding NarL/FixJ family response regulator
MGQPPPNISSDSANGPSAMGSEDMHMIRGALVALLKLEPDIEVVAELDRGDLVVETALRTTPDVSVPG